MGLPLYDSADTDLIAFLTRNNAGVFRGISDIGMGSIKIVDANNGTPPQIAGPARPT